MKHPLIAALLATLPLAPALGADWNDPQDPFQLFGNTYYVGVRGLSSVLITSPAGHILIDGGSAKSPVQIVEHIARLGFRIGDVKYILNSHEHFDHAGGIAELQRLSGATVLASAAGEQVLRTGLVSKNDPQYSSLPPTIAAVANTRVVKDGDIVTLGPLSVTAHATPGHAQGGVSWTWRSAEGGRTASMVYADSLNAISSAPFRYSANNSYPQARAELEKSIATVAAFDCEILVSGHPEASGLWTRLAQQATMGNTAFIERNACRDYANAARDKLASKLASEAAQQ
jgi:metallo-beta-lactamase class B